MGKIAAEACVSTLFRVVILLDFEDGNSLSEHPSTSNNIGCDLTAYLDMLSSVGHSYCC